MGKRIFLVGLSGSGKSTAGPLAARALEWEFVDADRLVEERTGRPVTEIFAEDGEEHFRALEAAVLEELSNRSRVVVATGGGAVMTEAGRQALARGYVVWLRLPPAAAAERLLSDPGTEDRPLLQGDPIARLKALAATRGPLYEETAAAILDVGHLSPAEVAERVVDCWRARKAERKAREGARA